VIETVTSPHPQDRLAQRSCPSCFGRSHPDLLPKKNDCDIFICLDGNFQHRHHERAEKGHLSLQTPVLFIPPDEVEDAKEEIRQHELALRKSDKAVSDLLSTMLSVVSFSLSVDLNQFKKKD
jgi:hypothetical protein